MSAKQIEMWVSHIGQTYDVLVSKGVIPTRSLTELYPGREHLTLHVQSGIELSFRAGDKCFETLYISLLEGTPGVSVYKGELPKPFIRVMTQESVRSSFGIPKESKSPVKLPKPIGMTGGWDLYDLDSIANRKVKVMFQYTAALAVDSLVFTVF